MSEPSCPNGGIASRIGCILTYASSEKDIILNYILLGINLLWCAIALRFHTRDVERSTKLRRFAIGSLVFVVLCQICLCLLVACAGISIIWCAMGGWIVSERKRLRETAADQELTRLREVSNKLELLVILADVGVIVYYAIVSSFITTVAHVCALIMGATLSLASIQLYDQQEAVAIESAPADKSTPLLN